MAIRDASIVRYISFAEGVDNTTSVTSPEIVGTLSKALNFDLVDDNLGKKRNGYTTRSTWGSRNIRAGLEYKRINGSTETLVYGVNSTTTGFSGTLGTFTGTNTPTTLTSNLNDAVKPSLFQFRSLIFILNGRENLIYDGTTTRQIGIDAPTIAPTLITTVAGDLVTSGSYLFAYSYYNSKTGAESSLSPASEIMVSGSTASQSGFRIGISAGSSATADKIRIYRTVSGGNTFLRETEINITETTYDSTIADTGLGTEAEIDNSRLFEAAKFGVVNDNRIFAAGFASNPNRIQYSKVGISGPMPESFQILDFIDCNINDGDVIVGLGKAGSSVIVIKERSVGRLIRVDASIGGLEREGSQKYIYEELSNEVTGLSHDLIVSLDNIIIWFGRDDIYGTDGNQIFRFGKRIRNTIKTLDFSQSHKWSCINKTDTQQILFAVTTTGKTECDFQIVGHYRNFPKMAFTFYGSGPNTTTHPGLVVGSFVQITENKAKKFLFGSAQGTGKIYLMDSGSNDAGLGIYFDVRLPWEAGSNPSIKKTFHSYYTMAAGSGVSPNNVLVHTWEEDLSESLIRTYSTSLTANQTTWGGSTWGGTVWSSVRFGPQRFFPKKKAYWGRYGFNNTYADQPVAIRSISGAYQLTTLNR